jgi:hypothetical protein
VSGWTHGRPTVPGHFWVYQKNHDDVYGPVYAFVYDGYPDDDQPPSGTFLPSDPVFKEWRNRVRDIGKFLRVRLVEGFAAGDHELRQIQVYAHIQIAVPVPEEPLRWALRGNGDAPPPVVLTVGESDTGFYRLTSEEAARRPLCDVDGCIQTPYETNRDHEVCLTHSMTMDLGARLVFRKGPS